MTVVITGHNSVFRTELSGRSGTAWEIFQPRSVSIFSSQSLCCPHTSSLQMKGLVTGSESHPVPSPALLEMLDKMVQAPQPLNFQKRED